MAEQFGKKLRYGRRQRNITQTDLAHRLGLFSHAHISHLEAQRKTPSLDLVVKVADALGTTTDYLLRDDIPHEAFAQYDRPQPSQFTSQERLFGAKLRHLRTSRGLTQVELARQLNLSANAHISFLETGKKEPSLDLVLHLADFFNVTTDYLLRDDLSIASTHSSNTDI